MIFIIVYPILVLLILHALGIFRFNKIVRVLYMATLFLLPFSPFFLLLIRYIYKNIDYIFFYESLYLVIIHIVFLPMSLVCILYFFLRSFSWWELEDIIIVAVFIEFVMNISNIVMGYSFFSFADMLIMPLVKMASVHLFICFLFLKSASFNMVKIANNTASHVPQEVPSTHFALDMSRIATMVFFLASFVNSITVQYYSHLSFYSVAYTFSLFSIIIGWGGIYLCYYIKNKS